LRPRKARKYTEKGENEGHSRVPEDRKNNELYGKMTI